MFYGKKKKTYLTNFELTFFYPTKINTNEALLYLKKIYHLKVSLIYMLFIMNTSQKEYHRRKLIDLCIFQKIFVFHAFVLKIYQNM